MTDYSKWIGKKVYASDMSIEKAEYYKKEPWPQYSGILEAIDSNKQPPFVFGVRLFDESTISWCSFVVLAEEELVPGDRVRVKDANFEYKEAPIHIFIGMIAGKYAVINEEDEYDAFIRGDVQACVSLWDYAEKVQPVKNISLEEALAKLAEVFGQPVAIKDVE